MKKVILSLICLAIVALSAPVGASTINPGSINPTGGFGPPAGTLLNTLNYINQTDLASNILAETYTSTVWSANLGGLIFEYQFKLNANSPTAVTKFSVGDFVLSITGAPVYGDAQYTTPIAAKDPFQIQRQDNVTGAGVEWDWNTTAGSGVLAGQTSDLLWIWVPNATSYDPNGQMSIFNGSGNSIERFSYEPFHQSTVPEPSTLLLLGAGLLGMGVAARIRRKA